MLGAACFLIDKLFDAAFDRSTLYSELHDSLDCASGVGEKGGEAEKGRRHGQLWPVESNLAEVRI